MVDAGKIEVQVGMDATPFEQGGQTVIRTMDGILRKYEDVQEAAREQGLAIDETTGKFVKSTEATNEASKATEGLNTSMINLSSGLYVAEKGYDYLTKIYNQFIGSTMAQVSALESLQRQTGMTWQETQKWKEVTDLMGVDMGYLAFSMRSFSIHMSQASVKTSEAGKTFKELGVEVKNANGTMRTTNDVFIDTLSALQKMPNETKRNQIAMQLYGRSWFELSKLMEENVDIRKALAEAEVGMTEEDKRRVKEGQKALREFNDTIEDLTTTIGVRLIPMFTALVKFLNDKVIPAMVAVLDRVEYLGYKFAHLGEKISFPEYIKGRDLFRQQTLDAEALGDQIKENTDSEEEARRLREDERKKDDEWLQNFINKSKGLTPEGEALGATGEAKEVQKQATDIRTLLLELRVGYKQNEDLTAEYLKRARDKLVIAYKEIGGIGYKQFTEQMKLINDAEVAEINSQTTVLASLISHINDKKKANEDYQADVRNLVKETANYEEYIMATKNQKLIDMWKRLKKDIEAGKIEALIEITQAYAEAKGGAAAGGIPISGQTQFGPMGWAGSEMRSFFETAMKVFTDQGIAMTQEIYNQILQAWGTGGLIPGQRLANQGPYEEWANTKEPVKVSTSGETTVTITGGAKLEQFDFDVTSGKLALQRGDTTVETSENTTINAQASEIFNAEATTVHAEGAVNFPDLDLTVNMPSGKVTGEVKEYGVSPQGPDIITPLVDIKDTIIDQQKENRESQEKLFGKRAEGGPTEEGKPYVVGETGPELFVPGENGTIVPFVSKNSNWLYTAGAGGTEAGAWVSKVPEGMDFLDVKRISEYWDKYKKYLTELGVSPVTFLKKEMRRNENKTISDTGAWKISDFASYDEFTGGGSAAVIYPSEFTNLWGERLKIDPSKPWGIQNPLKGSIWDLSIDDGKRYTDMALNTLGFRYPKLVQKYPFFRDTDSDSQAFDIAWYTNNPGRGMPPDVEEVRRIMQEENKRKSIESQEQQFGKISGYGKLPPEYDAAMAALEEERWENLAPETRVAAQNISLAREQATFGPGMLSKYGITDEDMKNLIHIGSGLTAEEKIAAQKLITEKGGTAVIPMQFGGPVLKGSRYLVGENRPEMFVPTSSTGSHAISPELVNIYVELDGEIIAKKIAAPLVGEIRLRTGVKL